MNTDDKTLEELARDTALSVQLCSIRESYTDIILAALHKAVEPYKKREAALLQEIEDAEDECTMLEEQRDALRRCGYENDTLRQLKDKLLSDWAEDDTAIRTLCKRVLPEQDVDGDSYGVPGFQELTEMLVKRIEQLEQSLSELNSFDAPLELQKARAENDALRKQVEQLKAQIEDYKANTQALAALHKAVEHYRAMIETLKASHSDFNIVCAQLNEENAKLRKQVEQLKAQIEDYKANTQALKNTLG